MTNLIIRKHTTEPQLLNILFKPGQVQRNLVLEVHRNFSRELHRRIISHGFCVQQIFCREKQLKFHALNYIMWEGVS